MKNNPFKIFLLGAFVFSFIFFLGFTGKAFAQSETTVEEATATVGSSTWITVFAPFTGDDNHNGYTVFEYRLSEIEPDTPGPWMQVDENPAPGPSEWRVCTVGYLTPGIEYDFRVIHEDPDGVIGLDGVLALKNEQVLECLTTTSASTSEIVDVDYATITPGDEEIFVSIPISGDRNRNSTGTIDVYESGIPELKASAMPFNPKRIRLRSLTPGNYWILIQISDGNVTPQGAWYQFIGPITYEGAENLALNKPITADPGYFTYADPTKLVDGLIHYTDITNQGFAWLRETNPLGDEPVWKQATIDLGAPTEFSKVVIWYHDPEGIPTHWKIQCSNDPITEETPIAFETTTPTFRTDTDGPLNVSMYYPSCAHEAIFILPEPATARYVRYSFDENTTLNGAMGWAVEIEVFNVEVEIPEPPEIEVKVDIRPGACPNSINLKKKGPAKAAILGAEDFDVSRIDPATVALTREGYETSVAPESFNYEDVATPFTGGPCECHDLLEDGFMDLVLKFDTQALIEAFELDLLADGETIPLILVGNLAEAEGGTPINGSDCITIKKKEKIKKNK